MSVNLMALAPLLGSFATAGCAATLPAPIAVEIRRSGDDGLTVRFADALETAFRQSNDFRVAGGQRGAGRLFVEIPRNLEWTESGGRVQADFEAEFKGGDSRALGSTSGSCWEDELEVCAAQVLRDARRIIARLR